MWKTKLIQFKYLIKSPLRIVFVLFICLFQFNFMLLSEDRGKVRAEGKIKKSKKKEKYKNNVCFYIRFRPEFSVS